MVIGGTGRPAPAELARRVAAHLAPHLAGTPGWSERDLLARVSPRPVGGLAVWRIPLAAALAAVTGDDAARWAELIGAAAERSPGVERVERAGSAVDVRFDVPPADLLPSTPRECRLWQGEPGVVSVRREGGGDGGREVRMRVLVDALAGLAEAAGAGLTLTWGGGRLRLLVPHHGSRRDIPVGRVALAGCDTAEPSPLTAQGSPSTPARAALLLARPEADVTLEAGRLLARTPANPGFLLVHTATRLAAGADSAAAAPVGDDGAESLVVALASYPFVLEKGAATVDPGMVLRHLLSVADRASRLRDDGGGARTHLRRSAATVLAHGVGALGMRLPARI